MLDIEAELFREPKRPRPGIAAIVPYPDASVPASRLMRAEGSSAPSAGPTEGKSFRRWLRDEWPRGKMLLRQVQQAVERINEAVL